MIRLNYLEFTGTQRLSIGVIPFNTIRLKIGMIPLETLTEGSFLESIEENTNLLFKLYNYENKICFDFNGQLIAEEDFSPNNYYDIELGNNYIKKNGIEIITGEEVDCSLNTKEIELKGKQKIYYLKIFNGENLLLDLIPVLNEQDIPCFYDKIGKTYFYDLEEVENFNFLKNQQYKTIENALNNGIENAQQIITNIETYKLSVPISQWEQGLDSLIIINGFNNIIFNNEITLNLNVGDIFTNLWIEYGDLTPYQSFTKIRISNEQTIVDILYLSSKHIMCSLNNLSTIGLTTSLLYKEQEEYIGLIQTLEIPSYSYYYNNETDNYEGKQEDLLIDTIFTKYLIKSGIDYYTFNNNFIKIEKEDITLNEELFINYGFNSLEDFIMKIQEVKNSVEVKENIPTAMILLTWVSDKESKVNSVLSLNAVPYIQSIISNRIYIKSQPSILGVEGFTTQIEGNPIFLLSFDEYDRTDIEKSWVYWDGSAWVEGIITQTEVIGMNNETLINLTSDILTEAILEKEFIYIRVFLTSLEDSVTEVKLTFINT